jgi:hypothetical protein
MTLTLIPTPALGFECMTSPFCLEGPSTASFINNHKLSTELGAYVQWLIVLKWLHHRSSLCTVVFCIGPKTLLTVALECCLLLSILGLHQLASLWIYCQESVIAFLELKAKGLSQEYINQKHCVGNTVTLNWLYGVMTQYVRFLSFCFACGEVLKSTVLSMLKF